MSSYTIPRLVVQSEIANRVQWNVQDQNDDRWSQRAVYQAINRSLSEWAGKVYIMNIYTVTGGFTSSTQEYTLPAYITTPIIPQRKIDYVQVQNNDLEEYPEFRWLDVNDWELEPTAGGDTQTLRVYIANLRYANYSEQGRVLWWAAPSMVPEDLESVTLSDAIDSDDTSLTIASALPMVGPAGYIHINDEWLAFAGVSIASGSTTLSGLTRGIGGSTASGHSSGDPVEWGIAIPDQRLWAQLDTQVRANMFDQMLIRGATEETKHYQWSMQWNRQQADAFWRSWATNRPIPMRVKFYGASGLHPLVS